MKPQVLRAAAGAKVSSCRRAKEYKHLTALIAAQESPATNEQLKIVWPLWNALSPDLPEHERMAILKGWGSEEETLHKNPAPSLRRPDKLAAKRKQELRRLQNRFPAVQLPLCGFTYNKALEAAAEWHKLKGYITANDHPGWRNKNEAALRYERFDDEYFPGRLALYRVAKEIKHLRPGFLEAAEPTLEDIKHLHRRCAEYERARRDAVEILSPLIFHPSLFVERNLPFANQTRSLPQPPASASHAVFPRHLYMARLARFGKCSPENLAEFMTKGFFELSSAERISFCDEYDRPKVGRKDYVYLRLWAWLAENAPVFNSYKAGWPNIFNEVKARFRPGAPEGCRSYPADYESLKVQWRNFTLEHNLTVPPRISPPIGAPRKDRRAIPSDLLTPTPDFSTVK